MAAETSTGAPEQVRVAVVQRRTLWSLSTAQVLGGVAVAGAVAAGALLTASIAGEGYAGLAQTFGVLGSALLALPLAQVALSRGRRAALSVGYGLGLLGAVLVVVSGVLRSLPLVLVGCLLVGVASAAGYQARYAATDLAEPSHRARSLSVVVWAGTVGAVLGPNLIDVSGRVAEAFGLPQLTGPYLQAGLMLALAVAALQLMRPDPYLLARDLASAVPPPEPTAETPEPASAAAALTTRPKLRDGVAHLREHRDAVIGVASVSLGHVVMVMVMVMTPVHMRHVDVSLQLIGLVISVHVLGMYAFSPVVGWFVDRAGRLPVVLTGAVVLLLACLVCGFAPASSVPLLAVGLFLLGLGWSCTLIAGSTLVTDSTGERERPAVQGFSDLVMNLSAAVGGVVAGIVVATASYPVLCAVAAVPVVALVVVVVREQGGAEGRRTADDQPGQRGREASRR
jgi:MFS family permease